MSALFTHPETLHPSLWLASQLARGAGEYVDTGYAALSEQLPGAGWPLGGMVELLLAQAGIGELRLLRSALLELASRRIVLVQPPYHPHMAGFEAMGVAARDLLWLRSSHTADALWATEQVLQSASCGVVLLWQQHVRTDALRRLHLAAQAGRSLFCLLRPLAQAQDASPAILRLTLRPAPGMPAAPGAAATLPRLRIDIIKRRGPPCTTPILLNLHAQPGAYYPHANLDRITPATTRARSVLPALVG